MPQQVSGRFAGLDEPTAAGIASASKRIMSLNVTPVIYDFTFDSATGRFTARRR
jgi:hypothetical protein